MSRHKPIVGTLLKGTMYRVEVDGLLSDKRVLEEDTPVRYAGALEGIRLYVLPDETLAYVAFEDDLSRASSSP